MIENVNINTAEFLIRCVNAIPDLLHEIDKQEGYVKERSREIYETLLLVESRSSEKGSIQTQLDNVIEKLKKFQSERDHYKRTSEQQAVELAMLRLQVSEAHARLAQAGLATEPPSETG